MPLPPGSKYTRQKRLMLPEADDVAVEKLAGRVAEALGTPVKFSHLLRASIRILHHAGPEILDQANHTRLHRPPNDVHKALEDFDARLARLLLVAIKKSGRIQ